MADHDATHRDETPGVRTRRADVLVAWHNLLQVSTRVVREFDRRLDLEHRISAREFDVLINLGNARAQSLRMTELANAAMLSSGGLTRLVGRLEERGFVRREQDTSDARSFHATLTDDGRARLAEARVTHDAIVRELFGARLAAGEVATMTRALERVLAAEPTT